MLGTLHRDLQSARDRDPAARSALEVAVAYSGVHAVWGYRISHWLWRNGHRLAARSFSSFVRVLTGVEIHPAAEIGPGLFIDHAAGVVIGETAEVGADVTLYQGVTLGGTSLERGKRHPTVGNRVMIGAGAKILGPVSIGDDSRIGANAVVVKDVPANSVVVGVPGQIIARSKPRSFATAPDRDDQMMPDLVGSSLQALLSRVDELEMVINGSASDGSARPSADGVWSGEDFSI